MLDARDSGQRRAPVAFLTQAARSSGVNEISEILRELALGYCVGSENVQPLRRTNVLRQMPSIERLVRQVRNHVRDAADFRWRQRLEFPQKQRLRHGAAKYGRGLPFSVCQSAINFTEVTPKRFSKVRVHNEH